MTRSDNTPDRALGGSGAKSPLPPELQPYQSVLETLESLRGVPERDPHVAAAARRAFLAEAARSKPAVSATTRNRLHGWKPFLFKERSMTTIVSLILALAVAFGGAGTAAWAAQDSLPDEALYPVKWVTEDIRLGLAGEPQDEAALLGELIQTRTQEMAQLATQGTDVPAKVATRLKQHLQTALHLCSDLNDTTMIQTLGQLRQHLEAQLQTMDQERVQQRLSTDQALGHAYQAMIQARNTIQGALEDPAAFRLRQGAPESSGEAQHRSDDAGSGRQGEAEPCQPAPCPNDAGTDQESGSGSGYGPGDGTCDACTPQGPGAGYGPGDGTCDDCIPQGTGTPQGSQNGPGGPKNSP
jgi:hypothetical protein